MFVNAVDDPEHATAYAGGVVRRNDVTIAISTGGRAPAMAGLLREALDAWLPGNLDSWLAAADTVRREWKAQGVPMDARRPQLLQVLNRLYEQLPTQASNSQEEWYVMCRRVCLTGRRRPGGPGALDGASAAPGPGRGPGAVRRTRRCRALQRLTKAQCFCVGKRAGRASVKQETIHRLMIRAARAGKRVVRLKGGDPFVFGRGAEEALALTEAGIAYEVVPGVTTAVAAAELAGIPVTHRGVSTGFLVVAGHTGEALRACDWRRATGCGDAGRDDGCRGPSGHRVHAHVVGLVGDTAGRDCVRRVDADEWIWTGTLAWRWRGSRARPAVPGRTGDWRGSRGAGGAGRASARPEVMYGGS